MWGPITGAARVLLHVLLLDKLACTYFLVLIAAPCPEHPVIHPIVNTLTEHGFADTCC
jgi:hypothetical protein